MSGWSRAGLPPMCRTFIACLLLTFLTPLAFHSRATAALIDIVVLGTWENTNVNTTINPLGLVNGDKFVMKSTYDDTTFFIGIGADAQGVTAAIDPTVNPGTSFDVIIPFEEQTNSFVFDHTDHTNIGFAATAQIEFDGPSLVSPGDFRNFEIHIDFGFGPNLYDFDTYMGAIQPESDLFNETQGFNLAALGTGGPTDPTPHLQVVVNDMTANAGGPYVFDALNLSLNLNGTSGGGNGFIQDFDWTGPFGALANSPGSNIAFGLSESGLVNTIDGTTLDLVVTESFTDFASPVDSANVSYANLAPSVMTASGTNEVDDSITFSATATDSDLAANSLVPGFETVTIEFLYLGGVFLVGGGNLDLGTLIAIFGGSGTFPVEARATDLAGATDVLPFMITIGPLPPKSPVVAEDFDIVDAGGTGWAGASSWGGLLTYVESDAIDPAGLQHARTSEFAYTTRALDPAAAAILNASDDVWIAYDARRDVLQTTSQFAGISVQSSGVERFFLGGLFDTVPWGGVASGGLSVAGTTPAGAEWNALMAHLDFVAGTFDIYVNGVLQASDTTLPPRDWNEVRIASGFAPANRLFVDRLRIGTTRYDVEPPSRARFVAAQWSDDTVRLLDGNRSDIGGFAAGSIEPNGIATDGLRVFNAHFITQELIGHDLDGNEILRWSAPELAGIQGLELVGSELAVLHSTDISFLDLNSGAPIRTLPYSCPSGVPEGLAFDGASLWVSCSSTLEQIDPNTAASLASIPNASSGCEFGGTGITVSAPGELTLACTNGNWFRVAMTDGSIIQDGNNGADMFGIKSVPEPGAIGMLSAGIVLLMGLRRFGGRRNR